MSDFSQTVQVDGKALKDIFFIHARALACHCECLGMNAENCVAMCEDRKAPYNGEAYHAIIQKWGLIDEKGNSTI
jgi:hypothetical protein